MYSSRTRGRRRWISRWKTETRNRWDYRLTRSTILFQYIAVPRGLCIRQKQYHCLQSHNTRQLVRLSDRRAWPVLLWNDVQSDKG